MTTRPTRMIRYTVRPDQVERNEALVRAVYAELERTRPEGLRYATFKLEDGVTFMHVAWSENEQSPRDRQSAPLRAVGRARQAGVQPGHADEQCGDACENRKGIGARLAGEPDGEG